MDIPTPIVYSCAQEVIHAHTRHVVGITNDGLTNHKGRAEIM
jgi:hypothetical protein